MMTPFEQVLIGARQLAGVAGKKTGAAVELSRLRMQARQLRAQQQSTFERLGILAYGQHKTGVAGDDVELQRCIAAIDGLHEALIENEKAMAAVREGAHCPACGFANVFDASYCKGCGKKLK